LAPPPVLLMDDKSHPDGLVVLWVVVVLLGSINRPFRFDRGGIRLPTPVLLLGPLLLDGFGSAASAFLPPVVLCLALGDSRLLLMIREANEEAVPGLTTSSEAETTTASSFLGGSPSSFCVFLWGLEADDEIDAFPDKDLDDDANDLEDEVRFLVDLFREEPLLLSSDPLLWLLFLSSPSNVSNLEVLEARSF